MNNSISSSERYILGTVQFGLNYGISNDKGQTTKMEIGNILSKSLQFGVDMLDTASAYGESEKSIGKHISRSFKIISKFPGSVKCSDDIKASLNESLLNLNVESLYGYLAHDA
ncbi:MAG: aldo/keto reductase, partial [Phormidesmis sp. FL-bin-119]|nr:aldo/keto reductase [Pedobacter sp.]